MSTFSLFDESGTTTGVIMPSVLAIGACRAIIAKQQPRDEEDGAESQQLSSQVAEHRTWRNASFPEDSTQSLSTIELVGVRDDAVDFNQPLSVTRGIDQWQSVGRTRAHLYRCALAHGEGHDHSIVMGQGRTQCIRTANSSDCTRSLDTAYRRFSDTDVVLARMTNVSRAVVSMTTVKTSWTQSGTYLHNCSADDVM